MPYALVTLNQTLFNQYQANVLCFSNIQEDDSWLQGFADEIRDLANSYLDDHMVTNWTLDNITVAFIDGDHISYSVQVDFTSGNLQGNVITDGMPGSSCMLASTSFVGPAPNRGRIYFSGFSELTQTDGQWDTSVRQDVDAFVSGLRAGITVDNITAVLQICRRPSDVFSTYSFNPVQNVNVQAYTRAQRRRNRNQ